MHILPHEIIYTITFFFTWAIILLAWPRRRTPGGWFLIGHLVALSIWVLGLYFEAISSTINTRVLWSQISYLGFTAATPFFFLFIFSYTDQIRPRISFILCLFIIPLFIDISAWTNQYHHLLWTNFHWGSIQYNILVYEHGPLYFIHVFYIYILVFFGLAHLLIRIQKSLPPFRSQLVIILIGGLFPLVSGTLYAFDLNPIQGMDISSFGFLLTDVMLSFGFAYYQLLDLVPVARDTLIKEIQDGILVVDWKNRIVEINQNAKDLLNIDCKNPLGKNYQDVVHLPIDLTKLSHQSNSTQLCLSTDSELYIDIQVSTLAPHSNNPPGFLIVLRDISFSKQIEFQLKKANDNLQKQINEINHLQDLLKDQATHDSLTGLNNRRLMDEVLASQLEQARLHNNPFSILVLDIDHFKNINDYYGHQIGDAMLKEVGKCIQSSTRANDYACRLGGDEILMTFQNMGNKEAEKKAEEIRKKLQAIVLNKENQQISSTVSIGIATFPVDGDILKELINRADQAMYAAKEKGRNRVVTASSIRYSITEEN